MKKPFTFAVISYNSEKYISETLDSIKYQVCNYGEERDIYLVISDDCSSDSTLKIVKEWIEFNKDLFKSIKLIESDVNCGVSNCYKQALQCIKTDLMKTIDGDDVFCSIDVMSEIEKLNDNDMAVFMPLRLTSGVVAYKEGDVEEFFNYYTTTHDHNSSVALLSTYKPFITPEVSVRRKYYNEGCLEFLSQFKQFEDDTTLYYIIKNNPEITLKFIDKPIVLYRIHDKSLSNGMTSVAQLHFISDLYKFRKYEFLHEKNICTKWILFWMLKDLFLMKHLFDIGNSKYCRMKKKKRDSAIFKAKRNKLFEQFSNNVKKILKQESEHYEKNIGK
ncbi:MAG: glycosyltransferase family 2 protein [Succinivibrio sp.]|nr:glycosyltransferase family 2 protein [Succinivibrio sp.]